jgi:hypothetical protein
MNLHEKITARLDELEALVKAVGVGRWAIQEFRGDDFAVTWESTGYAAADAFRRETAALIAAVASPDVVLRQVTEDRDVLKRHRPSAEPVRTPLGDHTVCVYCSDLNGVEVRVVGWPCWDAISLARRHGIDHGEAG